MDIKLLKSEDQAKKICEFFLSKDAFEDIDTDWSEGEKELMRNDTLRSCKKEGYYCWYIEQEGVVAGAIVVKMNPEKVGYVVACLAVNRNFKLKGVGTLLITRAEEYVRKLGGRYIIIDTGDNEYYEGARKFYEARGYVQVGFIPEYYNKDIGEVIYYKKLD